VKRTIKIAGVVILTLVIAAAAYYTAVVLKARRETPALVSQALRSDQITLAVDDLTPRQLEILIAVEDPRFFEHRGLDLRTPGAGWTTITQALVKIHYFDSFEPGVAKIKQSLIARFALDPLISKEDQLRLFLNEIYLGTVDGQSVSGFDRGARIYFDKTFAELTENEYMALVAMLIAPNARNVIHQPLLNAERVKRIERLVAGECVPNTWSDVWLKGCAW
jgi:membrane carboxypeptidase/penicillin-binding protein